ncbi:hypothetical protein LY78DRAFT_24628 [Colletotrichum sublineola]|nr:hypothetical protein LY78DRAFT_24628 [Colletotrichum sublineola]
MLSLGRFLRLSFSLVFWVLGYWLTVVSCFGVEISSPLVTRLQTTHVFHPVRPSLGLFLSVLRESRCLKVACGGGICIFSVYRVVDRFAFHIPCVTGPYLHYVSIYIHIPSNRVCPIRNHDTILEIQGRIRKTVNVEKNESFVVQPRQTQRHESKGHQPFDGVA